VDETSLIQTAKQGDVQTFNRLVLTYQQQVYNLALRMLSDESLAEDATQETFLAAYRNLHKFRGGSFRAWLLRIVINRCYDELRRQKRQPSQTLENPVVNNEEYLDDPVDIKDNQTLPEDALAIRQLENAVQNCIEQLSKENRAVVVLVDIQGMDNQAASDVVHVPLGTIKSRLARARLQLQDCLQGAWELLPSQYRLRIEGSG